MEVTKGKQRCLKLYHILDRIEKSNTSMNQKGNVVSFEKKFRKILKKEGRSIFFHPDVLEGKFVAGDEVEDDVVLPKVLVNGDTLLYRVLTKYKEVKKKDMPPCDTNSTRGTTYASMDKEEARKAIIDILIEDVPKMITSPKKNDECKGYSPIYMAIVKKHAGLLKVMIEKIKETGDKVQSVRGSILEGTSVMLAGTPLGVAALTLDLDIFKLVQRLYDKHADIQRLTENEKHDNIVHSMIKYFTKHQHEIEKGKLMLTYILDPYSWENTNTTAKEEVTTLLISKNMEHLTPLQLAAKRQHFEFFEMIIQCESYCESTSDDGLSTVEVYDITEMETIAVEEKTKSSSDENIQKVKHFSVLEFVYLQQMHNAFRFASRPPVCMIIKEKWSKYRVFFYAWFCLHLVVMSLLTWSAVQRSRLQFQFDNSSGQSTLRRQNPVRDDLASLGLSITALVIGVGFILCHSLWRYIVYWGCYKRFGARIKAAFLPNMWRMISTLPYTNQMFDLFFVLFALLLILDFPLAYIVDEYENQCLVFAVIIGWYLVLFFLQVFRRFSFFTVLIQRVLRDMFNFAIVMWFLLIGFTVAMFVVMQGADTTEDDFTSFQKALLKMFTVMLGIGELNDLFNARQPAMAVLVFVSFVLLTTILLLNALIAMMSNSCTELTSSGYGLVKANKMHQTLQQLSVIIFLESFLPKWLCQSAGHITENNRRVIEVKSKQKGVNDEDTTHDTIVSQVRQMMSNALTKKGKKKRRNIKPTNTVANEPIDMNLSTRSRTLAITKVEEQKVQGSTQ